MRRKIVGLNIYPVKGCQGIALDSLTIGPSGPFMDREWMLVDENGQFQTQRQIAKMAQIECLVENDKLQLSIGGTVFETDPPEFPEELSVTVWKSNLQAELSGDRLLHSSLSDFLGKKVRLVRYLKSSLRPVIKKQFDFQSEVRFADSAPLLLLNTKSLEDLNSKMEMPIGMDRFRGNIILEGEKPWEEDGWKSLTAASGLKLEVAYPCTRCVVITRDQQTGESPSNEPLKRLTEYRKMDGGVIFGQNAIHRLNGMASAELKLGESLELES